MYFLCIGTIYEKAYVQIIYIYKSCDVNLICCVSINQEIKTRINDLVDNYAGII